MSYKCQACRRLYKIDLLIPDELWEKIKPNGKHSGAGLLCGGCIIERLERIKGYNAVRIVIDLKDKKWPQPHIKEVMA